MIQYRRFLGLFFTLICVTNAVAKLPTGQWQTHLSYVEGQRLAMSETKVYCVASGSLYSYGKNDNALEIYSKITGLSDVYINDIAYCIEMKTLVIGYTNGNIDIMNKDGIINIPDLYLKAIYGDKTINKIDISGSIAYISTAFGILKLDIEKNEISETYKLSNDGSNGVNGVVSLNNEIYAATNNGLYKADINHYNLQDFAAWSLVTSLDNANSSINEIIVFNNQVIVSQYNENEKSYYIKRQDSSTKWIQLQETNTFQSFSANSELLLVSNYSGIKPFNNKFREQQNISSYSYTELEYSKQNSIYATHALPVDGNTYYVADKYQGLVLYKTNSPTQHFQPKGPATNTIWDINIEQNILRTVHGSITKDYNTAWTQGAYSSLINSKWKHFAQYNGGKSLNDFVGIITDPLDINHFYITTYAYGMLEYQDDKFILQHDTKNSSFGHGRTIGMAFDQENNLWVNNSSSAKQLHVKTNDDEWYAFESNLPSGAQRYGKMLVLADGVKWMVTPYFGDGILVYDDKGTFDEDSDDEDRYFSIYASNNGGSSELVSKKVLDIAEDNSGAIWVGSDNGVTVYSNPASIFDSNTPVGYRISRPRNDGTDLADYLLDETAVNSIAVDGGNRKWLATASTGVMLVSQDGQDVIHHFTKENSPLLSNTIRQVEVNNETGEVYFATDVGLISFQADATSGENDFSDIKVYPNPVRENFYGDITITGLVDETTVKITDVSGNLVRETTSNGGTAVWDGKNFYGERVGTGVYLIFCSDKEGKRSGMTKVLVIN